MDHEKEIEDTIKQNNFTEKELKKTLYRLFKFEDMSISWEFDRVKGYATFNVSFKPLKLSKIGKK